MTRSLVTTPVTSEKSHLVCDVTDQPREIVLAGQPEKMLAETPWKESMSILDGLETH